MGSAASVPEEDQEEIIIEVEEEEDEEEGRIDLSSLFQFRGPQKIEVQIPFSQTPDKRYTEEQIGVQFDRIVKEKLDIIQVDEEDELKQEASRLQLAESISKQNYYIEKKLVNITDRTNRLHQFVNDYASSDLKFQEQINLCRDCISEKGILNCQKEIDNYHNSVHPNLVE